MARIKYDSSLEIVENACCYCFAVANLGYSVNLQKQSESGYTKTGKGQMALKVPSIIKY